MNPTLPNRKHECQSLMGNVVVVFLFNFIFDSLGLYSSLLTKSSASQAGGIFGFSYIEASISYIRSKTGCSFRCRVKIENTKFHNFWDRIPCRFVSNYGLFVGAYQPSSEVLAV